jgi:predicted neutral ceramidase superfamily lipid hydrolase
MERGLVMLLHSVLIGLILYFFMMVVMKQSPAVAENRSLFLSAVILAYMILFGHGLPTSINKNLF